MQIDDFILGDTLGEGTFGKVKIATHSQTGEKVAVKILSKKKIKENEDEERISREINILKRMMHPNIAQLYSVIETTHHLYLIMEYCESGELFHHIVLNQRLSEIESCKLFFQLISGVEYLHKNGIVHRDLKPENLLLHKAKLKIVDFGLSNTYRAKEKLKTACGSPSYAAPEMILGHSYEGLMVDIWSCGIILYAMVCGCLPFDDKNPDVLFQKIVNGKFAIPRYLSTPLQDLLVKILKTDPKKRIRIEDIRSHYWLGLVNHTNTPGLIVGQIEIPLDNKIIEELSEMKFNKDEVVDCLRKNRHNRITTCYYLLVKKKINEKQETISDFGGKLYLEYFAGQSSSTTGVSSQRHSVPVNSKIIQDNNNNSNNNNINSIFPQEFLIVLSGDKNTNPLNTISTFNNKVSNDSKERGSKEQKQKSAVKDYMQTNPNNTNTIGGNAFKQNITNNINNNNTTTNFAGVTSLGNDVNTTNNEIFKFTEYNFNVMTTNNNYQTSSNNNNFTNNNYVNNLTAMNNNNNINNKQENNEISNSVVPVSVSNEKNSSNNLIISNENHIKSHLLESQDKPVIYSRKSIDIKVTTASVGGNISGACNNTTINSSRVPEINNETSNNQTNELISNNNTNNDLDLQLIIKDTCVNNKGYSKLVQTGSKYLNTKQDIKKPEKESIENTKGKPILNSNNQIRDSNNSSSADNNSNLLNNSRAVNKKAFIVAKGADNSDGFRVEEAEGSVLNSVNEEKGNKIPNTSKVPLRTKSIQSSQAEECKTKKLTTKPVNTCFENSNEMKRISDNEKKQNINNNNTNNTNNIQSKCLRSLKVKTSREHSQNNSFVENEIEQTYSQRYKQKSGNSINNAMNTSSTINNTNIINNNNLVNITVNNNISSNTNNNKSISNNTFLPQQTQQDININNGKVSSFKESKDKEKEKEKDKEEPENKYLINYKKKIENQILKSKENSEITTQEKKATFMMSLNSDFKSISPTVIGKNESNKNPISFHNKDTSFNENAANQNAYNEDMKDMNLNFRLHSTQANNIPSGGNNNNNESEGTLETKIPLNYHFDSSGLKQNQPKKDCSDNNTNIAVLNNKINVKNFTQMPLEVKNTPKTRQELNKLNFPLIIGKNNSSNNYNNSNIKANQPTNKQSNNNINNNNNSNNNNNNQNATIQKWISTKPHESSSFAVNNSSHQENNDNNNKIITEKPCESNSENFVLLVNNKTTSTNTNFPNETEKELKINNNKITVLPEIQQDTQELRLITSNIQNNHHNVPYTKISKVLLNNQGLTLHQSNPVNSNNDFENTKLNQENKGNTLLNTSSNQQAIYNINKRKINDNSYTFQGKKYMNKSVENIETTGLNKGKLNKPIINSKFNNYLISPNNIANAGNNKAISNTGAANNISLNTAKGKIVPIKNFNKYLTQETDMLNSKPSPTHNKHTGNASINNNDDSSSFVPNNNNNNNLNIFTKANSGNTPGFYNASSIQTKQTHSTNVVNSINNNIFNQQNQYNQITTLDNAISGSINNVTEGIVAVSSTASGSNQIPQNNMNNMNTLNVYTKTIKFGNRQIKRRPNSILGTSSTISINATVSPPSTTKQNPTNQQIQPDKVNNNSSSFSANNNNLNQQNKKQQVKNSILNTSTINIKREFEGSKSLEKKNHKLKAQLFLNNQTTNSGITNINNSNYNKNSSDNNIIISNTNNSGSNSNNTFTNKVKKNLINYKETKNYHLINYINNSNKSQPATKREKMNLNNKLKMKGFQPPLNSGFGNKNFKMVRPSQPSQTRSNNNHTQNHNYNNIMTLDNNALKIKNQFSLFGQGYYKNIYTMSTSNPKDNSNNSSNKICGGGSNGKYKKSSNSSHKGNPSSPGVKNNNINTFHVATGVNSIIHQQTTSTGNNTSAAFYNNTYNNNINNNNFVIGNNNNYYINSNTVNNTQSQCSNKNDNDPNSKLSHIESINNTTSSGINNTNLIQAMTDACRNELIDFRDQSEVTNSQITGNFNPDQYKENSLMAQYLKSIGVNNEKFTVNPVPFNSNNYDNNKSHSKSKSKSNSKINVEKIIISNLTQQLKAEMESSNLKYKGYNNVKCTNTNNKTLNSASYAHGIHNNSNSPKNISSFNNNFKYYQQTNHNNFKNPEAINAYNIFIKNRNDSKDSKGGNRGKQNGQQGNEENNSKSKPNSRNFNNNNNNNNNNLTLNTMNNSNNNNNNNFNVGYGNNSINNANEILMLRYSIKSKPLFSRNIFVNSHLNQSNTNSNNLSNINANNNMKNNNNNNINIYENIQNNNSGNPSLGAANNTYVKNNQFIHKKKSLSLVNVNNSNVNSSEHKLNHSKNVNIINSNITSIPGIENSSSKNSLNNCNTINNKNTSKNYNNNNSAGVFEQSEGYNRESSNTNKEAFLMSFKAYLKNQNEKSNEVFNLSVSVNMNVLVLLSNLKKILKEEKVGYTRLNNEWRFFCNFKTSINFEIEFDVNNSINPQNKGKENYQVGWIKFKFIEGEIDDYRMIAQIIFEKLFI